MDDIADTILIETLAGKDPAYLRANDNLANALLNLRHAEDDFAALREQLNPIVEQLAVLTSYLSSICDEATAEQVRSSLLRMARDEPDAFSSILASSKDPAAIEEYIAIRDSIASLKSDLDGYCDTSKNQTCVLQRKTIESTRLEIAQLESERSQAKSSRDRDKLKSTFPTLTNLQERLRLEMESLQRIESAIARERESVEDQIQGLNDQLESFALTVGAGAWLNSLSVQRDELIAKIDAHDQTYISPARAQAVYLRREAEEALDCAKQIVAARLEREAADELALTDSDVIEVTDDLIVENTPLPTAKPRFSPGRLAFAVLGSVVTIMFLVSLGFFGGDVSVKESDQGKPANSATEIQSVELLPCRRPAQEKPRSQQRREPELTPIPKPEEAKPEPVPVIPQPPIEETKPIPVQPPAEEPKKESKPVVLRPVLPVDQTGHKEVSKKLGDGLKPAKPAMRCTSSGICFRSR